MIAELIYTSAPKTLDGSGYGVVAKSEHLSQGLEKFMRQLNRYDFDLAAASKIPAMAPTVFSLTNFSDSSGSWQVMSRVAFGGYDFTHRAVLLAHHVAVVGDELQGIRPPELMQVQSLFQSEWDRRVGFVPPRALPRGSARKRESAFPALAQHADRAREWMDLWRRSNGQSIFLVAPEGTDVLAFFAAALVHHSDPARSIAFITHMNADRSGVRFDWIGLPVTGQLTESILNRFPDRTLDLTRPQMGISPGAVPKQKPSPSRPRSEATPTITQPVTPARVDQESQIKWNEYMITTEADKALEPAPALMSPPPPPLPGAFELTNLKTVSVVAAFAILTIAVGTFMLKVLKPAPREVYVAAVGPKPSELTPVVVQKPPTPEKTTVSTKPVNPPSQSKADLTPLRVVHLQGWLREILSSKQAIEQWVDLLDLDAPIPQSASLEILTCTELGLTSTELADDRGDGGLIIQYLDAGKASVSLRMNKRKLEARVDSTPAIDLLDRLQLSVLEISAKNETRADGGPSLRVVFTPRLAPASFSSKWAIAPHLSDGADRFFSATDKLEKRLALKTRLCVDRVSLSIFPRENVGWLFSPSAKTALDTTNENVLAPDLPGGKWKVAFRTYFDRGKVGGHPAIEATLTNGESLTGANKAREPETAASPVQQLRPKADPVSAKPSAGQENRQRPKASPAKDKKSAATKKEPGKTGPATLTAENVAQAPVENTHDLIRTVDQRILLSELFRRYGQAHGAVEILVRSRNSNRERWVEVLRFGDSPPGSTPKVLSSASDDRFSQ